MVSNITTINFIMIFQFTKNRKLDRFTNLNVFRWHDEKPESSASILDFEIRWIL